MINLALNKEIKKISGLITKYHRIKSLKIDTTMNITEIELEEYLDDTYRNLAKKVELEKKSITDLIKQIEKTTDNTIKNALIEKLDRLNNKNADNFNKEYLAGISRVTINKAVSSMKEAYEELIKLDSYKDATEI